VSTKLDEIINDLRAEQATLGALLESTPAADWDRLSHSPGWSHGTRSHITTDEAAARAIATMSFCYRSTKLQAR
jgi:hypothetical protein